MSAFVPAPAPAPMSAFKQAVLNSENPDDGMLRTRGENRHPALTAAGLGDSLLALFDKFFQGISERDLRESIRRVIEESRAKSDIEIIVNLFVMAFHTRWCRGGKGAKLPFYQCLKILYEVFPVPVEHLISLIPQYGYWKDLLLLLEEVKKNPVCGVNYERLEDVIWNVYAKQLSEDYVALQTHKAAGTTPSLSFAGKYAPREHKHLDGSLKGVKNLAKRMFKDDSIIVLPGSIHPNETDDGVLIDNQGEEMLEGCGSKSRSHTSSLKRKYREVVSSLATALDIPEVKMCAHQYSEIKISGIPSKCLSKNEKAFANERLHEAPHGPVEEERGNRYPHNPDRVGCRKNLINALSTGNVKGAQNYPHEYVEKVFRSRNMSIVSKLTVNAQWVSMRGSIERMVSQRRESKGSALSEVSLGNLVPIVDVSGSMHGTPMAVSIGLGILCSELANPAFKDLVLTFSVDATWVHLGDCNSFVDKVKKLEGAHWGYNTDFIKAMQRVADVVRDHHLAQKDIPNLLVISDMQFDEAWGSDETGLAWNTAYENIEKMFHDLGMDINGTPFIPPSIIFWNVRGSVGFPAAADDKGVILLSGYSPALMKFILSGEMEKEEEEKSQNDQGEVLVKKRKVEVTPAEALHNVLHDEALLPVRHALRGLSEHLVPHSENLLSDSPLLNSNMNMNRNRNISSKRRGIGGRRGGRHRSL